MSLFPAYSETSRESSAQSAEDKEWLTNSSYAISFPSTLVKEEVVVEVKDGSPSTSKIKKNKKEKKKHKKKERRERTVSPEKTKPQEVLFEENDLYFVDKERHISYLSMKTLPKTLKPRYFLKYPGLGPRYYLQKKTKNKRYYKFVDNSEGCKEGTLEDETMVSKKTENFNKKLSDDPYDISTWIEFVNFQDEFYKYQHIKYKSLIDRERAATQHKLSILDKGVALNPGNKELQALWLKIGTSVLPSEEMSSRIDKILGESGGTMTLWLGLMTTTQHSLARCTVPSVTQLYEKLLLNFQKVKQPDNIYGRDLNVLELLFHYGRFLDMSGHWEILWMMIKVNLQFNTKVDLTFELNVDEKVKQLENVIFEKEKQAIWQLWSQLERVREGLHFLPDSNSKDYPQRCVSPKSVVNFTWHFHPDLHFQLIVSFIVLLKVPLFPSTDTVLKILTPNSLPWAFDSPEFILSSVMTSPAADLQYHYLIPLTQLTRGPQYLRKFHGQTEFLSLITHTFQSCMKCLEGRQKNVLGVWWLRFERWIHLLNKLHLALLPDDRKTAKSFFKDFLKDAENRDNLLYYVEYSLLEFNQGNTDACVKTLKTLISSRPPVLSLAENHEKGILTSVYKSLCEVLIKSDRSKEALDILINLGNGSAVDTKITIHLLSSAEKKFEHVSIELIHELDDFSDSVLFEDVLMPVFVIEWISCYFWLVALVKTPEHLKNCYKKVFDALESRSNVLANHTRESLWEVVMTITWVIERTNFVYIKEILRHCVTNFPRNLKVLSFMADFDLQNHEYWWALTKTFLSAWTPFSCVFLTCLALDRFKKDEENFLNRVKNLLRNLALKDGKLLTIIHCLRLRFLYENENTQLENAQLQALESCPWNKSIYMESILLLPAKLMQLTDVLIEKELRIHITPDEIQEMRD